MPEPIEIEHLNHVARPTKRLEESRRFYIEVLGFREISRPAFSFRGSWLYGAGIQIHLIEDLLTATDPPEAINTRETHIAFAVPNVDAMEARLKEHAIPYKRSRIQDRRIHQLFFRDPDGHLIELGKYGTIDQ